MGDSSVSWALLPASLLQGGQRLPEQRGARAPAPRWGGLRPVAAIWAHSMLPASAKSLPLCLTL